MAKFKDFQDVKEHKTHNSNVTSQSAKKSTKPVPASAAYKLPPKTVLSRNFFAPLRTTDIDTQTTGAEKDLPGQEAAREGGRPPSTVMTSTTNPIQLQSVLK
jgi:hypothetical protein